MWRFLIAVLLVSSALIAAEADKSLIIVTTEAIKNSSVKLSAFIVEKEKRGFTVLVGTEKDYGGAGIKGQEKALLIREWLKTKRSGYKYLLLIGEPNPKFGDVPMLAAYTQGSDGGDYASLGYMSIPTDQIYRDLDGEGDCNGNGFYYEYSGDGGYECVSFADTFVTGRIPVYFNDVEELDKILDTAIRYMNQSESAAQYRKKMFFPMSYAWFVGYTNINTVKKENREFADVSEWLISNVLSKQSEYSWTRMYEKEGHIQTKYPTDAPLSAENMNSYWKDNGYGIVYWGGHGQPSGVVRTIWLEDTNGDELAQNSEVSQISLVKTGDFKSFSGETPGFVIALSCLVGEVNSGGNLTHDMLAKGAAIGVISSTFIDSPSYNTKFEDFESALSDKDYTLDLIGIQTIERMIKGEAPADVLSSLRNTIGTDASNGVFEHKLMMHYYGDPTLTLQEKPVAETPDTDTADSGLTNDADALVGEKESSGGCALISL